MPWGRHLEGGYPYPIMLCNSTQNSMGQTPRGSTLPGPVGGGGTLPGPAGEGYPAGGTQVGYPPSQVRMGVPYQGYPGRVPPGQVRTGGVPCQGGTQLGQQKEYSLHGGRYASCVHAGGLSCLSYRPAFLVHTFEIDSICEKRISSEKEMSTLHKQRRLLR